MAEDLLLSKWDAFCLQLEAFYPLLRSFLANEMYSDLLAPDDTSTEHMLFRLQWTAIQYAAIRQHLFPLYGILDIWNLLWGAVYEISITFILSISFEQILHS